MESLKGKRPSFFRGALNAVCALVFLYFLQEEGIFLNSGKKIYGFGISRRQMTEFSVGSLNYSNLNDGSGSVDDNLILNYSNLNDGSVDDNLIAAREPPVCTEVYEHKGYTSPCEYLISNPQCNSAGFLNYIVFFYCDCGEHVYIAYVVLAIWLIALFYLLGNTAADYFCCSLEKLSNLLRLPPTVAGATLLPLGNGAPDVFASIAAFMGSDSGEVGLNSVLGGALFVTCIVVGVVSLCVAEKRIRISKRCFFRDVCFLLMTLVCVAVLLVVGEVGFGGAVAYVSIYVVYVCFVAANEMFKKHTRTRICCDTPLLPVKGGTDEIEATDDCEVPLLLESRIPHWIWGANVAIYSNEAVKDHAQGDHHTRAVWGWNDEAEVVDDQSPVSFCSKFCAVLEIPLWLPRRLTIPVVEEERWSKGFAVASACLSPLLLAFLWNTQYDANPLCGYLVGAIIGVTLAVLAVIYTRPDRPPQRCLFPWVLGGFLMSITWFYMIANELVSLLVTFGVVFQIKPSILGLTVLAWGNSMGDLMSNVALAMNGKDGVQIAMSGCYAGPMFNTLAGLGISILLRAWSKRPEMYVIPHDSSLYFTLGFLILGLVWSLVVLPRTGMCPSKLLGIGLVAIYLVFLSFRLVVSMSALSFDGLKGQKG